MRKILQSFSYGLLAISFLYVSVFALPMMAMNHHDGMAMGNCPFMVGEVALCEMNVLDHIASWQAMLTTLPPVETVLFLLLALLLSHVVFRFLYDPPDTSPPRRISLRVEPFSLSFRTLLLGTTISPRAP